MRAHDVVTSSVSDDSSLFLATEGRTDAVSLPGLSRGVNPPVWTNRRAGAT
jgi:hypothetical protein